MSPKLYQRGPVWWTTIGGHRVSTRCRSREAAEHAACALEVQYVEQKYGPIGDDVDAFLMPDDARSHVYFIQAGKDGPIKIGYTTNRALRVSRLQTGCPERLRVVCVIPGGPVLERALHAALAKYALGGEWFKPGGDVLRLLAEVRAAVAKEPKA